MSAGKGDKPRPVKKKVFDNNFDAVHSRTQNRKRHFKSRITVLENNYNN